MVIEQVHEAFARGYKASIQALRHQGIQAERLPALNRFRTNRYGLGEGQSRDLESRD